MIKALFFKKNNFFYSFRIEGHAGYGFDGNDIVCAGVSSAVDMTINAIKNIVKQDCNLEINASKAVVFFSLKDLKSNNFETKNAQDGEHKKNSAEEKIDTFVLSSVFMKALHCHLANIAKAFPTNVSVLVSEV